MKNMIALSAAALLSASAFAMPASAQTNDNAEIVPGSEPMDVQNNEVGTGGALDSTMETRDDPREADGMATMEAEGDAMTDNETNAPVAAEATGGDVPGNDGESLVPGVTPE